MTANPDSALRQALVAAEKALAPFDKAAFDFLRRYTILPGDDADIEIGRYGSVRVSMTVGDLRRAREAHALITEALQRGEKT